MREQTGTFRVNCIDCLDRTNVVESALARHILTSQLTQVGITPDTLTSDIEFVYNDGKLIDFKVEGHSTDDSVHSLG
jgi:hypothetical protein